MQLLITISLCILIKPTVAGITYTSDKKKKIKILAQSIIIYCRYLMKISLIISEEQRCGQQRRNKEEQHDISKLQTSARKQCRRKQRKQHTIQETVKSKTSML